MSLLSDLVCTVQQSSIGTVDNVVTASFGNIEALKGYGVVSGSVEPRTANTTYLLLDDVTGDPVQLPPNALPFNFFFYPTEQLVGNVGLQPLLFSDDAMSSFYDPFGWEMSPDNINPLGCNTTALVFGNKTAFLDNFMGYPYVGFKVNSLTTSFTAGKVKVYLYYDKYPGA